MQFECFGNAVFAKDTLPRELAMFAPVALRTVPMDPTVCTKVCRRTSFAFASTPSMIADGAACTNFTSGSTCTMLATFWTTIRRGVLHTPPWISACSGTSAGIRGPGQRDVPIVFPCGTDKRTTRWAPQGRPFTLVHQGRIFVFYLGGGCFRRSTQ